MTTRNNGVDISYCIPEKELQGRRRMKDMDTGELWWEEVIEATVLEPLPPPPPPAAAPKKVAPDIDHFKAKAKK